MKYRESDTKSYRPAAVNLFPDDDPSPPSSSSSSSSSPSSSSSRVHKSDASGPVLELWTDGACSGNPGPMGIGVVAVDGGKRRELGEYLGVGTNNIAELTAIERGLEIASEIARTAAKTAAGSDPEAGARLRRVRVYSDSGYAIGLLEKGWKAKANQELVARLRKRVAAVPNLEFVKVPGHAGVPENERCDELARVAILRAGR